MKGIKHMQRLIQTEDHILETDLRGEIEPNSNFATIFFTFNHIVWCCRDASFCKNWLKWNSVGTIFKEWEIAVYQHC